MTNDKKLSCIKYTGYLYNRKFDKKLSPQDTDAFFDDEFCECLASSVGETMNSQHRLFEHFDFSLIFDKKKGELTEKQKNLLLFFIMKNINADFLIGKFGEIVQPFIDKVFKENSTDLHIISCIMGVLSVEQATIFFNNHLDEINDSQIEYFLLNLWNANKKEEFKYFIEGYQRINDIFIKKVSQPFYYEIIEDLNLENSYIENRKNNLKSIIEKPEKYDNKTIIDALCDYYFHDKYKNVVIDLKTLLGAFRTFNIPNELSPIREIINDYYNFLKDIELKTVEELSNFIRGFAIDRTFIDKLFDYAQALFKQSVSDSINKSYDSVKKTYVKSSEGKDVIVYDFENDSLDEKEVSMLISSIPLTTGSREFVQTYLSDKNGEFRYHRRSCSMINQANLSRVFGGNKRIILGYNNLENRKITSATLSDGQTDGNEKRFGRKRKTRECCFIPCSEFINSSYGPHNEISIEYNGKDGVYKPNMPSYILVVGREPTQTEIDIAAEFNVPIRMFNITKYKQIDYRNIPRVSEEQYDYSTFLKTDVSLRQEMIEKDSDARMM